MQDLQLNLKNIIINIEQKPKFSIKVKCEPVNSYYQDSGMTRVVPNSKSFYPPTQPQLEQLKIPKYRKVVVMGYK